MAGEMVSGYPVFVKDEAAGFVGLFVKVVLNAAIFLAGGRNEGDQSRAKFRLLTFSGLHFCDNCKQFGHTVMMIAQGGAAGCERGHAHRIQRVDNVNT